MKQIVENVPFGSLRSGDVVQAGFSKVGTVNVERDVPEPPKPKHEPGTSGTALVDGKRIPGMIDEDGDFKYLEWDGAYVETTYENMRDSLEFQSDATSALAAIVPPITRERFIQTLKKTAEDNGLVRLDHLQLDTLIVFAADRLGLY